MRNEAEVAAALRDLADHIEAKRIVEYDLRVDFGMRDSLNDDGWLKREANGKQTITIVVRAPTTLQMPGLLPEQRQLPKI